MATISEDVNIDMLEKKTNGTFKRKNPRTIKEQVKGLNDRELSLCNNVGAADLGSIVIGFSAEVSGNAAIAVGESSKAQGQQAVSLGNIATSVKEGIALGYLTRATGEGSAAIGRLAFAQNKYQGVLGAANANWNVPGSFSVNGAKNFEIPHPKPSKKDTHMIRHGAVESPSAGDTLYRYKTTSTKENDMQIINLPDYFIHLNKNVQIFVTPQGHFGGGYGILNREKEQLEIHCQSQGEYNVLVIGTRNDEHESIQNWDIKGVEREVGESWNGETYIFEDSEIILEDEYLEEVI